MVPIFCAADDISRLASAGAKMIKGAVVIIKGDWIEYSASLALPFWSSVMHPCFCCHATQDHLRLLGNFSALSSPFVENTLWSMNVVVLHARSGSLFKTLDSTNSSSVLCFSTKENMGARDDVFAVTSKNWDCCRGTAWNLVRHSVTSVCMKT